MKVALRSRIEVQSNVAYLWITLDDGTEYILTELESGRLSIRVLNRDEIQVAPVSENLAFAITAS